ncbi:hypothetical protein N9W95_02800, partial [Paracoccaceae bacterium]|nr:hypothetical protein [Paracoccaceae bacterium]
KTSAEVKATAVNTISGDVSEIDALLSDVVGDEVQLSGAAHFSLTDDSVAAADLIRLDGENGGGTVTVKAGSSVTGAASEIEQAISDSTIIIPTSATFDVAAEAGSASTLATDIEVIAGVNTTADSVDLGDVPAVTGSSADLAGLKTLTSLVDGSTFAVVVNNGENANASVQNILDIRDVTSGAITATITNTASADLVDLDGETGASDVLAITLASESVDAANLAKIAGATSVNVNAVSITNLTGNSAVIAEQLQNSNVTYAEDGAVDILLNEADNSAAASDLIIINENNGSGALDASGSVDTLTGNVDDVTAITSGLNWVFDSTIAIEVSGTLTVDQFNVLDNKTTGVITATVSDSDIANLANLTNNTSPNASNAVTLSVQDGEGTTKFSAAALVDLLDKTDGGVDASGENGIAFVKGNAAELAAFLAVTNNSAIVADEILINDTVDLILEQSSLNLDTEAEVFVLVDTFDEVDATELTSMSGHISIVKQFVQAESGVSFSSDLSVNLANTLIEDFAGSEVPALVTASVKDIVDVAGATGTVNASVYDDIIGLAADFETLISEVEANTITLNTNSLAIEVTDPMSVETANSLNAIAAGGEVVTGEVSASASQLVTLAGVNEYDLTVTGTAADAADLLTIITKTSEEVDADGITRTEGALSDIQNLFDGSNAGSPTITVDALKGASARIVLTDSSIAVSDLYSNVGGESGITTETEGTVFATQATTFTGTAAEFGTTSTANTLLYFIEQADVITSTTFQLTVEIPDGGSTETTAAALNALVPDLPGVSVNATAYTQVTGSDSDIEALISGEVITLNENLNIVLTNSSVEAANVDAIFDANGNGTIDFDSVNSMTGSLVDLQSVVTEASGVSGVNFGHSIDATVTDETVSDASNLTTLQAGLSGGTVSSSTITAVSGNDSQIGALGTSISNNQITIGNPAIEVSGTATVANISKIAQDTSGVITAEVDASTSIGDLLALPAEDNKLDITIAAVISGHNAKDLTNIAAKTTLQVDAALVSKVTGTASELDDYLDADINFPTNSDIVVGSGTATVTQVNAYNTAAGSGSVTASVADIASQTATLTTGAGDAIEVDVSNDSSATDAADLNLTNGNTDTVVNAGAVTSIVGSPGALVTLEAAATLETPTITLANGVDIEISGDASVDLINDLVALTNGDITATAEASEIANFSALSTSNSDAISISLDDTAIAATDLFSNVGGESGLVTKTSEVVIATSVSEVTGTVAELLTLINKHSAEFSLDTSSVKLTVEAGQTQDGKETATALNIKALADFTGGLVDATVIEVVKGVGADIDAVEELNDGSQLSIGNVEQQIYAAQPSDDTMYASDIIALAQENSSGTVDLALVNTIKGSYSDLNKILTSDTGTSVPNIDMDVSESYNLVVITEGETAEDDAAEPVADITKLNQLITGANEGVVTATVGFTNVSDLITINAGGGSNPLTITVAGTSLDAGNLNTIDSVTTVQVTTSEIATLTGTANAVVTAMQASGLDLNNTSVNIALDNAETATVTQLNDMVTAQTLDGARSATITATSSTGALDGSDNAVNLLALNTTTSDTIAITVGAFGADASQLVTLTGKTASQIDATAVTVITGAYADFVGNGSDTGLLNITTDLNLNGGSAKGDYEVVVEDTSLAADKVTELAAITTANVSTSANLTTVTGSIEQLLDLVALNDGEGAGNLTMAAGYNVTIDVTGGT